MADPNNNLIRWFKELVKNKMSAIAIPVAGISVSITVLTFSKLFPNLIGAIIAWAGLVLMLSMLALFGLAATMLVMRSLREPPQQPSSRGPGGRFLPRGTAAPMDDPAQQPQPQPVPRRSE
jgi:hypothetical protein